MGLLGTIVGGLTGAVRGLATGGPVGAITGGLRGLTGGATTPSIAPRNLPAVSSFAPTRGGFDTSQIGRLGPQVPTPGFGGTISRFLPGGQTGFTGAPPGYHLNKRYLDFYRAQQMGKPRQDPTTASQVVNLVVKNRKMNPLNPRALHRAVARERAAVRLMGRVLRGTGYHIGRRGMGGKTRRGRR